MLLKAEAVASPTAVVKDILDLAKLLKVLEDVIVILDAAYRDIVLLDALRSNVPFCASSLMLLKETEVMLPALVVKVRLDLATLARMLEDVIVIFDAAYTVIALLDAFRSNTPFCAS